MRNDFLESIKRAAAEVEHKLNLAGKELVTCAACRGARYSEPSRTDYDAHGPYYVAAVDCRGCGGHGRVEAPCSAKVTADAIKREIKALQVRLEALDIAKGGG